MREIATDCWPALSEEPVADVVALVHRLLGPEVHHHRLGADRQRPGEVVVVDGGLEVHEHLAGVVVRRVQVVLVVDTAHPAPPAAVERLHVERVADLGREHVEVERLVVLGGGVGPAVVVDRVLVGHQDRRRDLEAEPDHRAVRRVLLHRLEGEGAVQQVGAVDQRGLLQPLARVVVPVCEPVDHQAGTDRVGEGERLDREPFAREMVRRTVDVQRSYEAQNLLEGLRPVLLRTEEQADQMVRGGCHESTLARRPPLVTRPAPVAGRGGRSTPVTRPGSAGVSPRRGTCGTRGAPGRTSRGSRRPARGPGPGRLGRRTSAARRRGRLRRARGRA